MPIPLLYVLVAAAAAAAPARFTSGPVRVALIELYTSEGCSSCPPADGWLANLRTSPGLWKDFVPVEFHVNYWDGLGWTDRLSTGDFTAREYAYASAWGGRSVYTPCFVRNGAEWRPQWGTAGGPSPLTGLLSVAVDDDGTCQVEFRPGPAARAEPGGDYEIQVAVLGGGISSRVTAGENRGATLMHEFVVLGLASQVMVRDAGRLAYHAIVAPPRLKGAHTPRRALAAWVTPRGELEPVQATGGWLHQ